MLESVHSENSEFRFQYKPLDNAIGLGARVLLEAICGVPIKILFIVVHLNEVTHILGLQYYILDNNQTPVST